MSAKKKIDAPLARVYELAAEQDVTTAAGLARLTGLSHAGVLYWRKKGLSRQAANNLQDKLGWNADYVMDGTGPKFMTGVDLTPEPDAQPVAKRPRKVTPKPVALPAVTAPAGPMPATQPVSNGELAMYFDVAHPLRLVLANAGKFSVEHAQGQTMIVISPR